MVALSVVSFEAIAHAILAYSVVSLCLLISEPVFLVDMMVEALDHYFLRSLALLVLEVTPAHACSDPCLGRHLPEVSRSAAGSVPLVGADH